MQFSFASSVKRLGVLGVVFAAGWYTNAWHHNQYAKKSRRVTLKGYNYTSPLLDLEMPEGLGVNFEPLPFKHKVSVYVKEQIANGYATDVAVYFRDLHDGPWFGINENKEFDPASLMKVVVMVAWLKRADKDPNVLGQVIANHYVDDLSSLQTIRPAVSAKPGQSYTVDRLIRVMMNYSDNNATRLLFDALKAEEINDVLDGMDVDNKLRNGGNRVTVHGYSGLFRILYNSSYLSRNMSEKALHLLTLQDFAQGLVAGVPKGIEVASKFGEATAQEMQQLHEFGIVYHPKHTYILGVMSEGKDKKQLAKVIQGVSRLVYTQVDAGTFSPDDHSR